MVRVSGLVDQEDPAVRRDPFFSQASAAWAFFGLLIAAIVCYWPGLSGPWLFDDTPNLEPVRLWLQGDSDWRDVVLQNTSGPGGRPLSMGSFVLNALLGGYTPFSFKLGNLLLHLFNGVLVFALFRAFARHDASISRFPLSFPLALAAIWLLHPLLVSTTLYAVQRMAMLSACFMLLAMLAYIHGRELLASENKRGLIWLFLLVPLASAGAFLSKENGLVTPLLCGVIELVYFRPHQGRRPIGARLFLLVGVAVPVLFGLTVFALWPERFVGGYENRPFTLLERALTQPRVLFDYTASIALPWGPRLGLFRDDYPLSTGLFTPPATLIAITGWAVLIATALVLRKRIPALAAGIGIFLVGHALESSIFPLLIYFEHRNYLPAIGLLWAMGGLLAAVGARAAPHMDRPRLVFGGAALLLVLAFALATHARATVWKSLDRLLFSSLEHRPGSAWLRMNIAQLAMDAVPQRADIARTHLRYLLQHPQPGVRQMGWMNLTAIDCLVDHRVESGRGRQLFTFPGKPIDADLTKAIENASTIVRLGRCEGLPPGRMAEELDAWLDASPLRESTPAKSRLRYQAAVLYAASRRPSLALEQADLAWSNGRRDLPLGGLRVGMLAALGRQAEARQQLSELRSRSDADASLARNFLDAYEAKLGEAAER